MKTKKTDEHMSFNNRYQHFVFHQLQVEKLETFLDGRIQDCYEHIEVDPVKFYSADLIMLLWVLKKLLSNFKFASRYNKNLENMLLIQEKFIVIAKIV